MVVAKRVEKNTEDAATLERVVKFLLALIVYVGCLYIVLTNSHWTDVDRYANAALLSFTVFAYLIYVYLAPR